MQLNQITFGQTRCQLEFGKFGFDQAFKSPTARKVSAAINGSWKVGLQRLGIPIWRALKIVGILVFSKQTDTKSRYTESVLPIQYRL